MERIFHERAKRVFTVHFALLSALCRPIQVREKEPRAVVAHHLVNLLDPLKDHLQLLSFCRSPPSLFKILPRPSSATRIDREHESLFKIRIFVIEDVVFAN